MIDSLDKIKQVVLFSSIVTVLSEKKIFMRHFLVCHYHQQVNFQWFSTKVNLQFTKPRNGILSLRLRWQTRTQFKDVIDGV